MQNLKSRLERAVIVSLEAGKEILKVYNTAFEVDQKADHSPLTQADLRAHNVIVAGLAETGIPILSEEGKSIPYETRKTWVDFWMVDPLDGTKEFVKRNGEFTVNIALIRQGKPLAGVIYVPVTDVLYFGLVGWGSFKMQGAQIGESNIDSWAATAMPLPRASKPEDYTVVSSRSHRSEQTEAYLDELKSRHGNIELVSMGSSLKICLVAEGVAHEYPRFAPTMEWDTAAGHAIAAAAGREIYVQKTGRAMEYNKENLLNEWFIVK